MNQKDKLALEYSEIIEPSWNARLEAKKGWLAGFDTARKLMLECKWICAFDKYRAETLGKKDEI